METGFLILLSFEQGSRLPILPISLPKLDIASVKITLNHQVQVSLIPAGDRGVDITTQRRLFG